VTRQSDNGAIPEFACKATAAALIPPTMGPLSVIARARCCVGGKVEITRRRRRVVGECSSGYSSAALRTSSGTRTRIRKDF
jgi:hypothetical protein